MNRTWANDLLDPVSNVQAALLLFIYSKKRWEVVPNPLVYVSLSAICFYSLKEKKGSNANVHVLFVTTALK